MKFITLTVMQIPNIWTAIRVVADTLMHNPTLTSDEVASICSPFLTEEDYQQAGLNIQVLVMAMIELVKDAAAAEAASP